MSSATPAGKGISSELREAPSSSRSEEQDREHWEWDVVSVADRFLLAKTSGIDPSQYVTQTWYDTHCYIIRTTRKVMLHTELKLPPGTQTI
jgi:hypothetical protein